VRSECIGACLRLPSEKISMPGSVALVPMKDVIAEEKPLP
jgi:hypothetical protein